MATCRGCGGSHFASEALCPRTKRPISEGHWGSLVGPYRVGKLLGAGGFGAVHAAEDTRTGVTVALKLLHPELVTDRDTIDRFIREAEVTARAGNPHIVRVLEASFTERAVYVALELIAGDTLANTLRGGALPAEQAVDIAIQMLDGLAVAHALGIIHRDVKPANVFLADTPDEPRSLVKLLDFGIGRLLGADEHQRLTRTGTQLGTPHFMAPEQVIDAKRADARADLYAVAVTLFAMLSATRPYGQAAIGEWIALITRGTPAPPVTSPFGRLPPLLVEVVAIGLSLDPARRFQDAGSFARALLDSLPSSKASTRALPAIAATATFQHAPNRRPSPLASEEPTRRPSRVSLLPVYVGTPEPPTATVRHSVQPPPTASAPPKRAPLLLGGVLLVVAMLGAAGAFVAGLILVRVGRASTRPALALQFPPPAPPTVALPNVGAAPPTPVLMAVALPALPAIALNAGALPAGAPPAGALPAGAPPAGALPAGALPAAAVRPTAAPPPVPTTRASARSSNRVAPADAEALTPAPEARPEQVRVQVPFGQGVRFLPPRAMPGTELDLSTIRALATDRLGRFDRCRVPGRPSRASVQFLVLGNGSAGGRLGVGFPSPSTPNEAQVSTCVALVFRQLAEGAHLTAGRGGEFTLTADLDAR